MCGKSEKAHQKSTHKRSIEPHHYVLIQLPPHERRKEHIESKTQCQKYSNGYHLEMYKKKIKTSKRKLPKSHIKKKSETRNLEQARKSESNVGEKRRRDLQRMVRKLPTMLPHCFGLAIATKKKA